MSTDTPTSDQMHCLAVAADESMANRIVVPASDGWVRITGPWIVTADQLVDLGLFERDSAKRPSLTVDNTKGAKYRPTDAGLRLLAERSTVR